MVGRDPGHIFDYYFNEQEALKQLQDLEKQAKTRNNEVAANVALSLSSRAITAAGVGPAKATSQGGQSVRLVHHPLFANLVKLFLRRI